MPAIQWTSGWITYAMLNVDDDRKYHDALVNMLYFARFIPRDDIVQDVERELVRAFPRGFTDILDNHAHDNSFD